MGAASFLEDIEERRNELRQLIERPDENHGRHEAQILAHIIELADRASLQLQDLLTQPDIDRAMRIAKLEDENRKFSGHNLELREGNHRVTAELVLARREIERLNSALTKAHKRQVQDVLDANRKIAEFENLSVRRLFRGGARIVKDS